MSSRSKEAIQAELDDWYIARGRVQKGQSYSIGTRTLTRADLADINATIKDLEAELARADTGGAARMRRGLYAG